MPGRSLPTTPAVLILGTGPAGLALAWALKQRGGASLLLEKGPEVAHSWARMPASLKLLSPWKANCLPSGGASAHPPNHEMAGREYGGLLQDYARRHELAVVTNAEVRAVAAASDKGFVVHTSAGTFTAPLLVNATGYFAAPFTPEFPGARAAALPQFHFADYRDAEHLRSVTGKSSPLVLIVGKRLSAGHALMEFAEAGFQVALSCRGPIQFGSGPIGWWIFFRLHPALERIKLFLFGSSARGVETRMPGGRARHLVESGSVPVFPDIARFEGRRVTFTDGRTLEPDAVLYATGFRPALAHLASLGLAIDPQTGRPALRGFESAEVPGLFFLGLDRLRNFRSRFLRGIREDAPLLAAELANRVGAPSSRSARISAAANTPSRSSALQSA